jgi:hypothetical protein
MKKLVLAIGFGAYVVFGTQGSSLAAYRDDSTASRNAARDSRIAYSETGTSPRLLFVNEQLYPDTAAVWDTDNTFCAEGNCLSR